MKWLDGCLALFPNFVWSLRSYSKDESKVVSLNPNWVHGHVRHWSNRGYVECTLGFERTLLMGHANATGVQMVSEPNELVGHHWISSDIIGLTSLIRSDLTAPNPHRPQPNSSWYKLYHEACTCAVACLCQPKTEKEWACASKGKSASHLLSRGCPLERECSKCFGPNANTFSKNEILELKLSKIEDVEFLMK